MGPYILLLIWIISAIVFEWIARRRGVAPGFFWRVIVVFLGPLAIPLAFLARPERERR